MWTAVQSALQGTSVSRAERFGAARASPMTTVSCEARNHHLARNLFGVKFDSSRIVQGIPNLGTASPGTWWELIPGQSTQQCAGTRLSHWGVSAPMRKRCMTAAVMLTLGARPNNIVPCCLNVCLNCCVQQPVNRDHIMWSCRTISY